MKITPKTSAMLAVGLLVFSGASAQSTLNVTGHSAKINGMTFDYSIGEMTLVSTEKSGNLIVTQGLLQPGAGSAVADGQGSGQGLNSLADRINVYPSPTQNVLYVETEETLIADYGLQLFDAAGKVVLSKEGQTVAGTNRFTLDLQSFAGGNYYLMVRKPGADGKPQTYSFKIQKVN
jgi:hypothetical protein